MELRAQLSFEVGWHMSLLLKFFLSVGVGAASAVLALAVNLEISAELSLLFALVLIFEQVPFLVALKVLFLRSSSGLAVRVSERVVLILVLRINRL